VSSPARPRLGVSSCLLGEAVRWDGGHRRDTFLTGTLARVVEWVPVCPEVEVGMGVPRFAQKAGRRSHRNVLAHLAGFVSDALTREERAELRETTADYAAGLLPLIVPVMLRHHARKQGAAYVLDQASLSPHPKVLMLRNHV
jgi:hypothetical protein